MANMTFGVNIIPKANANATLGNSDNPWTIVSPDLTGTPTAPTASSGTNTTQIATTAFVYGEVSDKACKIYLTSEDNTKGKIDEKIDALDNGDSATIYIHKNAMNILSNGARNDYSYIGVVSKDSISDYSFILKPYASVSYLLSCSLVGFSYSSTGTYTEQCFNNANLVHTTGAETVAGVKIFTNEPVFSTAENSAEINFGTKNLDNSTMGVAAYASGSNGSGVYANGRFVFCEVSAKSDGSARAGGYERYRLPEVSANVTSAVNYEIITTKNLSDITGVVHTTGDETIAGIKTLTDNLYAQGSLCAQNSATLPYITMRGSNQGSVSGIIYLRGGGTATGDYDNAYFSFVQYSKTDKAARGSYERYDLPTPPTGLSTSSVYKIITTNNLSDITGFPSQIILGSTDTTWDKIWAKISVLANGDSATFYANSACMSALTNGNIASGMHCGVIIRTADTTFRYLIRDGYNVIRSFNMTNVTSSSAGTYAGKSYDDDILIHTTQYQTTDFGSVTIANFQTALDTLAGTLDEGACASFKVSLTNTDTQITASGAYTGIMTKGVSTRRNAIIQFSGSTALVVFFGSYTSSGWKWKKNVYDTEVVHSSGAETVGGAKTFSAVPIMRNAQQYPAIHFCGNKNENVGAGIQAMNIGSSSTEYYGQTQFGFYAYSPSSNNSSVTSYFERFLLPAVDKNRSASADFNIITTKNLSDIDTSQLSGVAKTVNFIIAKSASVSYTLNNSSRIVLDLFGVATNQLGEIRIAVTSSGTVYFVKNGASDVTVTKSTSTLTIANNNTSNQLQIYGIVYLGGIAVQTT